MIVGDHQLDAAQTAVGEASQEVGPEGLGLRRTRGDAQHLALAVVVDRDGDYHGTADDAPAFADLQIRRIEPEVGPGSLQGPGEERVHALVDLDAEAADLGLRHAARAHRLDQVVHGPGRNAVDVGFLNDGHERLLRRPPRFEEAREVRALPQLRDLQRDAAGAGVPVAVAVSVPLNLAQGRTRALRRAGPCLDLRLHDPLGRESQHLAHEVAIGLLLNQLDQRHSLIGHRRLRSGSRSCNPNLFRRPTMAASVTAGRALRYAGGSARGLLHHVPGHDPPPSFRSQWKTFSPRS